MKQRLFETPTIEINNELMRFSRLGGFTPPTNIDEISEFLKTKKGNVYFQTLINSFDSYISGNIDVFKTRSINVLLISKVINIYIESARDANRYNTQERDERSEMDTPIKSESEIEKIMTKGFAIVYSQYANTFYSKIIEPKNIGAKKSFISNNKLVNIYMLSSIYGWMESNGKLNPNDFTDEMIEKKYKLLKAWSNEKRKFKNVFSDISHENTLKAAIVALTFDSKLK